MRPRQISPFLLSEENANVESCKSGKTLRKWRGRGRSISDPHIGHEVFFLGPKAAASRSWETALWDGGERFLHRAPRAHIPWPAHSVAYSLQPSPTQLHHPSQNNHNWAFEREVRAKTRQKTPVRSGRGVGWVSSWACSARTQLVPNLWPFYGCPGLLTCTEHRSQ